MTSDRLPAPGFRETNGDESILTRRSHGAGPPRTIDSANLNPMLNRRRSLLAAILGAATLATVPPSVIATAAPSVLLVVGDSISAGYGLPSGTGWVNLLASRLQERGYPQQVVNASISGDTTAGGRARLPALLAQHRPSIVAIELGGNDGLRGGDLKATRNNLDAMVATAQKAGAKVLLIGMRLPPNYGGPYTRAFESLFVTTAEAYKVPLVPFIFDGFGHRNDLFQPDRIHPTAAAQPLLLDNVWPKLVPLLGKPR